MDLTDEIEVQTRHKRHLEKLREKEDTTYGSRGEINRGSAETSERDIWTAQRPDQGIDRSAQGNTGEIGRGAQGMEGWPRTDGRSDQGIRSLDTEAIHTDQSTGRDLQSVGEGKLTADLTPEEKAEKERELARQRKQRQRDREKLEASQGIDPFSSSNRDRDRDIGVTPQHHTPDETSRFQLKNPLKLGSKEPPEKVKLFSKTEAEDSYEALKFVYMNGTSILDDILEIVVKGHEAVQIWEMDEDEAALFVNAHLKRAQKDQDAARTARVLLRIHDKLMSAQYLLSRSKATVTHVRGHGGLSFK